MENTHLTNKILEDSFSCFYKVVLNKDKVTGSISDYEQMHLEIKQNISIEYENHLMGKGAKRDDLLLSNAFPTEKTYTANIVYCSPKYSIIFDFVEVMDIEGVPDYDFFYLIGALVKSNEIYEYHYFWVNDRNEEETIWKNFFDFMNNFSAVPIYHYGNYETEAIKKVKKI